MAGTRLTVDSHSQRQTVTGSEVTILARFSTHPNLGMSGPIAAHLDGQTCAGTTSAPATLR